MCVGSWILPNNSIIYYFYILCYISATERPRRSHKSFFYKRSQRKCKPEKCYKNEMKIEIKEKRGKNRGISCWNFCELWQKSEMTQSVCPTSVINPLWNQLEPFPTPIPFSVFCFPFSLFPFPLPASQINTRRMRSCTIWQLPERDSGCLFPVPPVALCPSLAKTGSTSSYDSVWEFAFPAQAGSVCGMHRVWVQHFVEHSQNTATPGPGGTQEPSCEQDMDRTETETETTTMQMQMQSSQN